MAGDYRKRYICWSLQICTGGWGYTMLEVFWRGYSHISMYIAGGIGLWLLIRIATLNMHIVNNILLGGLCITILELICGCVVNLWLGLRIWDYSYEAVHFLGQICPRYTLLWILLCSVTIPFCRIAIRKKSSSN